MGGRENHHISCIVWDSKVLKNDSVYEQMFFNVQLLQHVSFSPSRFHSMRCVKNAFLLGPQYSKIVRATLEFETPFFSQVIVKQSRIPTRLGPQDTSS